MEVCPFEWSKHREASFLSENLGESILLHTLIKIAILLTVKYDEIQGELYVCQQYDPTTFLRSTKAVLHTSASLSIVLVSIKKEKEANSVISSRLL